MNVQEPDVLNSTPGNQVDDDGESTDETAMENEAPIAETNEATELPEEMEKDDEDDLDEDDLDEDEDEDDDDDDFDDEDDDEDDDEEDEDDAEEG